MANGFRSLSVAVVASLAIATSGSTATPHSDRLDTIDHALAAEGYRSVLTSRDPWNAKYLPDGSYFTVTLWMKAPAGKRLGDARQIKFNQAYCVGPGFSRATFFAEAQAERRIFFRDVIGQAPPPALDTDMRALDNETKFYTMPHYRKVRLMRRPLKCDARPGGGWAYEPDLFP